MSFIKAKQYDYDSYMYYKIASCNNRQNAFEWFAKTVSVGLNNVKNIRLDDLKSFHDGTITVTHEKITDVDAFVAEYSNLPFEKISVVFCYNSVDLVLKVNLDDFVISIACPKGQETVVHLIAKELNLA